MFGIFSEIATTLRRNRLRTFLTGFSISWGIFMLIILLAAGNGLKNGVTSNFGDRAVNKITIWAGMTTIPFKGYSKWREIKFDNTDSIYLSKGLPQVDQVIPTYDLNGKTVTRNKQNTNVTLSAVVPEFTKYNNVKITKGRFINELDVKDFRKVMVISDKDALILFSQEDPIGKEVVCDNIPYMVIGIHKANNRWQNEFYVPFSTLSAIYNPSGELNQFTITVNGLETAEDNDQFDESVRNSMARKHEFSPLDENAIHIWNMLEEYLQTMKIFNAINLFVWIVGIGTLIAGIVGVGNIMLITVRERTKEFGIQKALGAKPSKILTQVVLESLIITSIFGYIGMISGIILTEIINYGMTKFAVGKTEEFSIFLNPTVDLGIAISATLVLVVAGVLAGYFPAKRAVKIKPIEALRYE
jgi:putative ABC transport system permease protein